MSEQIIDQVEKLTSIGISLSKERNLAKLLEKILIGAKEITHADGGTLYLVKDRQLEFEIIRTESLGFAMGGTTNQAVTLPSVPLFNDQNKPNLKNISAFAAVTGTTVNISDAYNAEGFDFSGVKEFDKRNNYRSQSFLTVPMRNHQNETIGVLQLINSIDPETRELTNFSVHEQKLAESLASQAAIAITNFQLLEDLRHLLEKFIEIIAHAIDDKSPYTGGHCRRVPEIAQLLARGVNKSNEGPFRTTFFNDKAMYELNIAALLHDCGKITTPVHVVDKATKLETIFDRIAIIDERIQTLKKDKELELLKRQLAQQNPTLAEQDKIDHKIFLDKLDEDYAFLKTCNKGSEFMGDDAVSRIQEISNYQWCDSDGNVRKLIEEDELHNLCIPKGTLTDEERVIVNHHIVMTQKMLKELPFPSHLKNVPEIAGNHHERMDGKGYPNGIEGKELSIAARIMCIADVFEALTAADRPYKKAMNLSTALRILGNMKLDSHIDPDLFDVFVSEKIYLQYAEKFLEAEQIDDIDITKIPGYNTAINSNS